MALAVSNARVELKGNAIVITKQATSTAKIDPLMAAFNAVAWDVGKPGMVTTQYLCDLGCELICEGVTDTDVRSRV